MQREDPYVVGSVVGGVMTKISQDEAQVLLGAVQRFVVVAVVALLVTQREVGWQRRQLGSNVGGRGVQVTPAPQGGTLAGPQELCRAERKFEREGQRQSMQLVRIEGLYREANQGTCFMNDWLPLNVAMQDGKKILLLSVNSFIYKNHSQYSLLLTYSEPAC